MASAQPLGDRQYASGERWSTPGASDGRRVRKRGGALHLGPHRLASVVDHTLEPRRPGQEPLALSWFAGQTDDAGAWLFLHGLGADRKGAKARRFRDHLVARGRGFAALDFTGHGDSGGNGRGLSLSRNLDDIGRAVAFLAERVPSAAPSLIGSSMGGIAALWYAALHPRAVSRVYAIAPAFGMAARLAASLSGPERAAWARRGFLPFSIGERLFEFGWGAVADEARYPDSRLAARLITPSLLLHGTDDPVVPAALSRDFAAACPAASLQEIEGGDHRLGDHRDLIFEAIWSISECLPGSSQEP